MNSYQRAEREVLRAFALQVLTDPTSSVEDRASAEARLLNEDAREPSFKRLTTDELKRYIECTRTVRELLAKARGNDDEARGKTQAPAPSTMPTTAVPAVQPQAAPIVADLAAQDECTIRAAMATTPRPYTLAELLGR